MFVLDGSSSALVKMKESTVVSKETPAPMRAAYAANLTKESLDFWRAEIGCQAVPSHRQRPSGDNAPTEDGPDEDALNLFSHSQYHDPWAHA